MPIFPMPGARRPRALQGRPRGAGHGPWAGRESTAPKGNDPKDNDPKDNDPKDNDPKDNDPKDNDPKDNDGGRANTGVVVKPRAKVKKPSMYKVLMLNDDYTPMEFVVHVLERYFSKSTEEATRIMLQVHQKGVGVCGVFTFEIAETKVNQTMELARKNQHPLQCTLEKE